MSYGFHVMRFAALALLLFLSTSSWASAQSTTGPATLTEESIKEWEQKYPSDPWLAKTVYMPVLMYAKIPTAAGHSSMEEMKQATPPPNPGG
ncbi:MAG: hypothetical protein M3N19_04365 [Candidatus Eremiobacteraeota bacterium]|nr:hypothetical protein [Candidatus Eremiobacteraeota bacterium]